MQRGSTLYGPHAIYYTTKGSWLEWAPPSTGFRQPYWRHYPEFATTISRLCWLLSQGRHRCDVALFYPVSSVQSELTVSSSLYDASWRSWRQGAEGGNQPSAEAREVARVFWEIAGGGSWRWQGTDGRDDRRAWAGALDQMGLDFDVIDEDSLQRAAVDDGSLALAGEEYRVLVFPQVSHLPRGVLERAADLARSGGLVAFVGRLPRSTAEGGSGDRQLRRLLDELLGTDTSGTIHAGPLGRELPGGGEIAFLRDASELVEWLEPRVLPKVRGDARALHRQVEDLHVYLVVPPGLAQPPPDRGGTLVTLSGDDLRRLIDRAVAREPVADSVTVRIRQTGPVEQWDPLTGRVGPATVLGQEGGWTTVELDLRSAPVGVLVFGHAPEPALPASRHSWETIPLGGEWASDLVQTADNRFGDLAWPPEPTPLPIEVRVLRMMERNAWGATSPARDVVCGFEPRAETSGPYAPGQHEPEDVLLQKDVWRPARYSTRLGIEKDRIHRQTLGPRAHVPPEFLDLGQPPPGSVHYVRTHAIVPAGMAARLRIIATGAISAWLGGRLIGTGAGEMVARVFLEAGANQLAISLAAPGREITGRQARLRAGFHFLPADVEPPYGHTLPDVTEWLNEEGRAKPLPGLSLDPHPELAPRQASYSCRVPPGANSMRVASRFVTRAWIGGGEISPTALGPLAEGGCTIDLPYAARLHRTLTLECELPAGASGGAAFEGPLEFDCGSGTIGLGGWRDEGLPHFVGGVRYSRSFHLDATPQELILDLGRVRGTAEVALNGRPCGVRIWSPYRFDLTREARPGENRLEITVFGTLGNYYLEGHPSPYGLRSQAVLGLHGPVILLVA